MQTKTAAMQRLPRAALVLWLAGGGLACSDSSPAAVPAAIDVVDTAEADAPIGLLDVGAGCVTDADCPAADSACAGFRCGPGGACVADDREGRSCDDGEPCTFGDHCQGGQCQAGADLCDCHEDADCAAWEDGDACNGSLYCALVGGRQRCAHLPGSAVTCPPAATVCLGRACDPATGQCLDLLAPKDTPCSDGDPCTADDACDQGACAGKPGPCQCQSAADCAALEDGDLCNGTLYCDKSAPLYVCKVNPATVVACPAGPPGACSQVACLPESGTCVQAPVADDTPCDDGQPCTAGDHCEAGACVGSGDVCSCTSQADCADQDDGNLCNGTLYCDKSVKPAICKLNPATVVGCPTVDDTACAKNACLPKTGTCAIVPTEHAVQVCDGDGACRWELKAPGDWGTKGPACDDGDACTAGDACQGGTCKPGADTCLCQTDQDCAAEDDGDVCNGTLYCHLASQKCLLNPATVVTCQTVDDTACTKHLCQPKTGACAPIPVADGAPCDDGDGCTTGDTCQAGVCASGTFTCTCTSDAGCAEHEDGNACNGTLFCNKAKDPPACDLNPATLVTCPTAADTACLHNVCLPVSGKCQMVPAADGTVCDDGVPCTFADACAKGACQPGADTCECLTHADCAKLEDGDACNGTLYCDKSLPAQPKCKLNPATVVKCAKIAGACAVNACNPATGLCQPTPTQQGAACDDGSACTNGDACDQGLCQGQAVACDDGDVCTADSCDLAKGCLHVPANCQDGNPCTVDQCDAETGACAFAAGPLTGKSCDADGNGCTVNDVCQAGTCVAGPTVACQIPLPACQQAACASQGPTAFQCVAVASPDGAACDDPQACTVGATCTAGQCQPGLKERLFVRGYAATGAAAAGAVVRLADGGAALASTRTAIVGGKPAGAWWLQRVDPAGDPMWQLDLASPQPDAEVAVTGVVAADGGLYASGTVRTAGGLDLRLIHLAPADGKVVWSQTIGAADADELGHDLVAWPGGGFVVTGERRKGGHADLLVTRLSASGQLAWQVQLGGAGDDVGRGAAVAADGGVLAVGSDGSSQPGKVRGRVARLGPDGQVIWQQSLGVADEQTFAGVATAADGSFLLVGEVGTGPAAKAWLLRLDDDGVVRWQRATATGFAARRVVPQGAGFALVGTARPSAQAADLWLAGLDGVGNLHWERSLAGGGAGAGLGLAVAVDGGLALAGQRLAAGKVEAVLALTDPWGHATCAAAGTCAKLAAKACDDGGACTADTCDPAAGCQHVQVPAMACTIADGCTLAAACKLGTCEPGAKGKLFQRLYPDLPALADVVALADGGFAALSLTGTPGDWAWHLARFDRHGERLWHRSWPWAEVWAHAAGLTVGYDGSLIVVGSGNAKTALGGVPAYNTWYHYLQRLDADGNPIWTGKPAPTNGVARSVVAHGDGTFVVVGGTAWPDGQSPVLRFDADGKVLWSKGYKGGDYVTWPLDAAIALPDGRTVAGGRQIANNAVQGLLLVVGPGGALEVSRKYTTGLDAGILGLSRSAAGGYLLVGRKTVGGAEVPAWLRTDATGEPLWAGELGLTGDVLQRATEIGGGFALAGTRLMAGESQPWLVRLLGSGQVAWQGQYPQGQGASLTGGLWPTAQGGLATGGKAQAGGQVQAMLLRVDAWGHATCAGAGTCAGKQATDCDDGNPCTADLCDATKGCAAKPLDGGACGAGKVCKAGLCS